MGRLWSLTALLVPWLSHSSDVCAADGTCEAGRTAVVDKPCSEVLEVLAAGESQIWARAQPAVISGVADAAGWNSELFSRKGLRSEFGSVRVKVFSPAQAALMAGQTLRAHPIRHIIPKLQDAKQTLYVFDKDFFQNASAREAAQVPEWLAMSDAEMFLTMGGPFSGTQFHAHGAAFLTLFAGQKRWHLHPPGAFPNASARVLHRSVAAFEATVLPALGTEEAPTSCVQNAGETVYVPDGWAHATINVDETIGVAWQRPTATTNACRYGSDYVCLTQSFVSVPLLSAAKQPAAFKELFQEAEEITGGFPAGFLRHIAQYWNVSSEAKDYFKEQKSRVFKFLKEAKKNSDEAVLGACLVKALVDALFTAKKDVKRASDLLAPAAKKVPEAGIGVPLAQLLGQQKRWKEAVEHLERHIAIFPDDATAAAMIDQAAYWYKLTRPNTP